jgi:hypothetical protein
LVDEIVDEDSAKVVKGKADIIKFLMASEDKERFGGQKVAEGGGVQITFVVDTGIRREEIPTRAEVINVSGADQVRVPVADNGELLAVEGQQEQQGVRDDDGPEEP